MKVLLLLKNWNHDVVTVTTAAWVWLELKKNRFPSRKKVDTTSWSSGSNSGVTRIKRSSDCDKLDFRGLCQFYSCQKSTKWWKWSFLLSLPILMVFLNSIMGAREICPCLLCAVNFQRVKMCQLSGLAP